MRIQVRTVNIVTEEHAHGFRSAGRQPKPQITIPSLKARLSIEDARILCEDLRFAVDGADNLLRDQLLKEKAQ